MLDVIIIGGGAAFGSDFDGMECQLFLQNALGIQILTDAVIQKFGFSVAEKSVSKTQ